MKAVFDESASIDTFNMLPQKKHCLCETTTVIIIASTGFRLSGSAMILYTRISRTVLAFECLFNQQNRSSQKVQ